MPGTAWSHDDDLVLFMEIFGVNNVKLSKEVLEKVAKRLPGGRTPKAVKRRWENLNDQYKVAKSKTKASSSPESTPSKPKPAKAKSRTPKGKGKTAPLFETSTPCSTPSQSNDDMTSPEHVLMQPKRWSSREQNRKNYAKIDYPEERDDSEGIEFENVAIKTE